MPSSEDPEWKTIPETTHLDIEIIADSSFTKKTSYYAWYKDALGNISTYYYAYLDKKDLDTTEPSISSIGIIKNESNKKTFSRRWNHFRRV